MAKTRRRGHVERIGADRWRIRWYVGRGVDGRRLYQRRTLTGTKQAAERELAEALKRAEGGFIESDRTVATLVAEWLKSKETSRKVRARTARGLPLPGRQVRPAVRRAR